MLIEVVLCQRREVSMEFKLNPTEVMGYDKDHDEE